MKFSETMQRFLQQCMEEDESFFEGNILLEHIIGSGAYGTMENHMGARLLKEGGEKNKSEDTHTVSDDNAFPAFGGNERTFSGSKAAFIFGAGSMDLAFGHEDHFCK